MKKLIILALCSLLFGCSTTKYVEKQSEELSRAVYATKDSIDYSRLDLADNYATESTRLVTPPKQRISIKPITKTDGQKSERALIIPQKYRSDKVVVVDSPEYKELLKDAKVAEQLKVDLQNQTLYAKEVDKKLTEQYKINNEMIVRIQYLEKQVLEKNAIIFKKDLTLLRRNITIAGLISAIAVGIYLRMKGVL